MKRFLNILLVLFVCFNLTAQQSTSDKVYRDVSLNAINYLYLFQNINPMLDTEGFLESFSEDAKILNDIPSLHVLKFYKNSQRISPGEYVDFIVNDPLVYDPSSIMFDLIIREIGDLEFISDNEGVLTVYATKKRNGWALIENGFKFSDALDLEFKLYFLDNVTYYQKEVDRITKRMNEIPISEQVNYNPEFDNLELDLIRAEKNLEESFKNPNTYYFEIQDISLSKKEKRSNFGYVAKSKELVKRLGPVPIDVRVGSIFTSKKRKKIYLETTDENKECSDTIISTADGVTNLDVEFCEVKGNRIKIKPTDEEYTGTKWIDLDNLDKQATKKPNQLPFIKVPINEIKFFVDIKYKYNLSSVRYFSDNPYGISDKKNYTNSSTEYSIYYTLSDLLAVPNNFKIFMGLGFENAEYHYGMNSLLYNEETYTTSDYADAGNYDRNVRLQNINEEQILEVQKIIFPKFEFFYKFDQKIFNKIKPGVSFFVGFNQLTFKSISYKSTADGYYSGVLEEYFNQEIYDSHNIGVHNFGGYVINSGDFQELELANEKGFMVSYGLNLSLKLNKTLSFKFGLENSKYSGDIFQDDNIEEGQPELSGHSSQLNSLNNIIDSDELRFFTVNFGVNFKF